MFIMFTLSSCDDAHIYLFGQQCVNTFAIYIRYMSFCIIMQNGLNWFALDTEWNRHMTSISRENRRVMDMRRVITKAGNIEENVWQHISCTLSFSIVVAIVRFSTTDAISSIAESRDLAIFATHRCSGWHWPFTKQINDVNPMAAPCTSRIREIFFRIAADRKRRLGGGRRETGTDRERNGAKVTATAGCKYALGNSICQERRSTSSGRKIEQERSGKTLETKALLPLNACAAAHARVCTLTSLFNYLANSDTCALML